MRILPVLLCALVLAGLAAALQRQHHRHGYRRHHLASGSSRMTLGVNSYLWHASLDTLSFLPLAGRSVRRRHHHRLVCRAHRPG